MDIAEIKQRIKAIENSRDGPNNEWWNDPAAHVLEDDLYRDFVAWLGTPEAHAPSGIKQMARVIAQTSQMGFSRWYE